MKPKKDPMDFWAPVYLLVFLTCVIVIAACQAVQTYYAYRIHDDGRVTRQIAEEFKHGG